MADGSLGLVCLALSVGAFDMRVLCSRDIVSPPEIVFPWIAVPENAMKWQNNVKAGETILTTPGVVGTTFTERVEEGGRGLEMHGVITKYEVNNLIGFHLRSRIHELDVTYRLEAIDHHATRLSVDACISWKFPMNIVTKLNGARIQRGIAEQMSAELLQLKGLCEG